MSRPSTALISNPLILTLLIHSCKTPLSCSKGAVHFLCLEKVIRELGIMLIFAITPVISVLHLLFLFFFFAQRFMSSQGIYDLCYSSSTRKSGIRKQNVTWPPPALIAATTVCLRTSQRSNAPRRPFSHCCVDTSQTQ